jgi:hypothetical protein
MDNYGLNKFIKTVKAERKSHGNHGLFNMKRYILLMAGLTVCLNVFSQRKCDSLSQKDKLLLQKFWTDFKDALNNKDKTKLSTVCNFPFDCDYCILDTAKQTHKPHVKVTKSDFDKSQYQIFFIDRLINEVNKYNLPHDLGIFLPAYNAIDKRCIYSFGYIVREENKQHPGMKRFFDVQKINGLFKITSTWTIP